MSNEIPPMTDPLGRHWRQPSTDKILIDKTHAVMDQHTFEGLAEYSSTNPSGVYPGKMWKGQWPNRPGGTWYLRWYGEAPGKPHLCSNNQRIILIA